MISLQIASFNRTPLLVASLRRVGELTLPDEILVIDDGSSDGCREALEQLDLPIRYVYNDRPYPALSCQPRNLGLQLTDCDVVVHAGPEHLFVTDVIAQMCAPSQPLNAATCQMFDSEGRLEQTLSPFYGLGVTGYRKEWMTAIGGWDEQMPGWFCWEDQDLSVRLRLADHEPEWRTDIVIAHQWHPLPADIGKVGGLDAHEASLLNRHYLDEKLKGHL